MEIINSTGSLIDATGKQISANVEYEIYYLSPTRETLGEWHGNFTIPLKNMINLDRQGHTIILEDKRKGKIILTRMKPQPNMNIYYEFQGTGPLK